MAEAPVRRAYQVYLYAVCFVAVLVLLFTTGQALFGVVRIALPEQTASEFGGFGPPVIDVLDGPPADFDPIDRERDRGVARLLENAILALLAGGVFAFHWRSARRLREQLEGRDEPPPTAGAVPDG